MSTRLLFVGAWIALLAAGGGASAQDPLAQPVLNAIDQAKRFLLRQQQADGSFPCAYGDGGTSLALIALINTGMTAQDPEIQRGLEWLRTHDARPVFEVYAVSLKIQALAAAKDGRTDVERVAGLVRLLESGQLQNGSWTYRPIVAQTIKNPGGRRNAQMHLLMQGDNSNAQFAVLGLREAQEMGVPVSVEVWHKARNHFVDAQCRDGGWSYGDTGGIGSTGSMTVAGIATVVITDAMLKAEANHLNRDGTPQCCEPQSDQKILENAYRWMGNNFTVRYNPAAGREAAKGYWLYYLYGMERAGRFSGKRFFTNSRGNQFDWYREGAENLLTQQNRVNGSWNGDITFLGKTDNDDIVGTSMALIFLSKGLAPVLFNKLEYGQRDPHTKQLVGRHWNQHPDDIRNLTQQISGLPGWPKLLNWQTLDLSRATVDDLRQAPIAYISGNQAPRLTARDVDLLRQYISQGGFLLAVNNCQSATFDEGFRDLVRQLYPPSEARLQKLGADHPVFRAEYDLVDEQSGEPAVELWGLDVGCRTSIIYTPHDLSCLWDKWTSFQVLNRPEKLVSMITRASQVGVNIVAYVTGRQVLNKLGRQAVIPTGGSDGAIERDLVELRQIRYTGDWDAAPQALKRIMQAARGTAHLPVAGTTGHITLVDRNIHQYPLLYMHGRHDFQLSKNELEPLRKFLDNGGFLFADACCGSPQFDQSFRELMKQVYPEQALEQIPVEHELFLSQSGYELKTVRRREAGVAVNNAGLNGAIRAVEPFLEGILVNNRYVVVYSKYDISCALERQASVACNGYIHEDAVKLAVNILVYGLNQ